MRAKTKNTWEIRELGDFNYVVTYNENEICLLIAGDEKGPSTAEFTVPEGLALELRDLLNSYDWEES